jgi:enoyl-[acyl-carrier protein] reductase I
MSNNLLKGKRGIIFGALNPDSIAWKVAERAYEEGAIPDNYKYTCCR